MKLIEIKEKEEYQVDEKEGLSIGDIVEFRHLVSIEKEEEKDLYVVCISYANNILALNLETGKSIYDYYSRFKKVGVYDKTHKYINDKLVNNNEIKND